MFATTVLCQVLFICLFSVCMFATIVFISHAFGMQFKFNDILFFFFFKPTYRPKIFDWVARETTNQFGMAFITEVR